MSMSFVYVEASRAVGSRRKQTAATRAALKDDISADLSVVVIRESQALELILEPDDEQCVPGRNSCRRGLTDVLLY
jgi:hypothetical protein